MRKAVTEQEAACRKLGLPLYPPDEPAPFAGVPEKPQIDTDE